MKKTISVLIDTTPLGTAHAVRGIGMYTRMLAKHLIEIVSWVKVFSSPTEVLDQEIDVIHYPYFDLFAPTLPLRRKKPTVVTVHDVIPLVFSNQYKPGIKGSLWLKKQQLALRSVAAVITDSESSKKDIAHYLHIPNNKIHVVLLAAHPELYQTSEYHQREVAKKYALPKKYILYVGDINYNKNVPQLIKSLKYMDESISLVCVGKNFVPQEIPEWQWIETQVALSNVADRVHFLPAIGSGDISELAAVYGKAVALVHPSLYEGFGLTILEAMQCLTPVVCGHNSSLIEVAGDHAVYVGEQPTAESIAAGVAQVLSWGKQERESWTQAAFTWSQQFSWAKAATKTAQVYETVLSK